MKADGQEKHVHDHLFDFCDLLCGLGFGSCWGQHVRGLADDFNELGWLVSLSDGDHIVDLLVHEKEGLTCQEGGSWGMFWQARLSVFSLLLF